MKMLLFARRNGQEILRDPLNLAFGLVFPPGAVGALLRHSGQYTGPHICPSQPDARDFSLWFQLFLPVFRPSGGPGPDQRLFPAAIYNASAATGLHLGYTLPWCPWPWDKEPYVWPALWPLDWNGAPGFS